jgi:hypothetical protein
MSARQFKMLRLQMAVLRARGVIVRRWRKVRFARWQYQGSIGVDSGQMMLVDPCSVLESDMAWKYADACELTLGKGGGLLQSTYCSDEINREREARLEGCAFVTRTHSGDGVYPVRVKRDRVGRVTSVCIHFT